MSEMYHTIQDIIERLHKLELKRREIHDKEILIDELEHRLRNLQERVRELEK